MSDTETLDSTDELTPAEPTKRAPGPNAWKAGRKPNPKGKRSRRYGTDEFGGKLAVRSDPKVDVAEKDDPAYKKFSLIVGGKEGLKELASWSENPKAQKLFELLDNEKFKTYGIKALAKRCGMTLPELCNLFREKHFLEMFLTFFAGVPEIAKGAVEDAKPSTDVCPMCGGSLVVKRGESSVTCPKCEGAGRVRVAGDKEARRDVFKAVGVIKDSASIINNQIGNVTVEGVDDFEALMKSAQTTPITKAKNEQEVKEAEIIEG